jgi:anion-transporting  ArsA/GET3 family ATPase
MTLERQVHFVSGKGGVGKSSVACALALLFQEQGKRTLLAQVNAADSHSGLLGLPPIGEEVEELEPGLFTVNVTPRAALREYALMKLRFEALYKAAVENRVVQRFLRFVPSLPELNMLGKIWYHAEERDDAGQLRYERIVVDCPSTGHGLGFLRVSQVVRAVVRAGPVAQEAEKMASTFEDPARTRVHVVTLPEDMPTNETLGFIDEVRRTGVAPLGYVLVNQVMERGFDEREREALGRLPLRQTADADVGVGAALARVLLRRLTRDDLTAEQIARLESYDVGLPVVQLPLLLGPHFRRAEIGVLAKHIGEAT